jgi:hypothetical protein
MLILPVDCLILHRIIPLLKQFLKTAPDNTGPHEQPYSNCHYNEQNIRSKDYRITIIPEKNGYYQQRYHSQDTQYNTQGYADPVGSRKGFFCFLHDSGYPILQCQLFFFQLGLPELLAGAAVVGLHLWKKNTLLSIAVGTALYMVLVQAVFV